MIVGNYLVKILFCLADNVGLKGRINRFSFQTFPINIFEPFVRLNLLIALMTEPFLRISLKETIHKGNYWSAYAFWKLVLLNSGLITKNILLDLFSVSTFIRSISHQKFIYYYSDSKKIRGECIRHLTQYLRCHIPRGSTGLKLERWIDWVLNFSDSKIGQSDISSFLKYYILGFDITVNHSFFMYILKSNY